MKWIDVQPSEDTATVTMTDLLKVGLVLNSLASLTSLTYRWMDVNAINLWIVWSGDCKDFLIREPNKVDRVSELDISSAALWHVDVLPPCWLLLISKPYVSWDISSASLSWWCYVQTSKKCVLDVLSSKWFKPPRDHFLFGNSLRNSRAVLCFFLLRVLLLNVYHQRKTAFCLSTLQLGHHKVRVAQVWWLNLIIELATVSVIHVQKRSKYQNKHIKVMTKKLLASFLWTQCIYHWGKVAK